MFQVKECERCQRNVKVSPSTAPRSAKVSPPTAPRSANVSPSTAPPLQVKTMTSEMWIKTGMDVFNFKESVQMVSNT